MPKKLIQKLGKISSYTLSDFAKDFKNQNKKQLISNFLKFSVGGLIGFYGIWLLFEVPSNENIKQLTIRTIDNFNKKNKSEIAQIAKKITVQIEGVIKGSGVIVKKDGNRFSVLTSWHVLKDIAPLEELKIITFDGEKHNWESMNLKKIKEVDLAVISFRSQIPYETAKIGHISKVGIGDQTYVSGFPLETSSIPTRYLRVNGGEVIGITKLYIPDGYQIFYTNDTLKGMSGGALLDFQGRLIGIHGRTEKNDLAEEFYDKLSSSGVNMAIPINFYTDFLEGKSKENKKFKSFSIDQYISKGYGIADNDFMQSQEIADELITIAKNMSNIKESPEAFHFFAIANFHKNKFSESIENLTKAIELDPRYYFFLDRGIVKAHNENHDAAIKDFSQAIKMNPKQSNNFFERAYSKYQIKDFQGAIKDIDYAIKLDPENPFYYLQRGKFKKDLRDLQNGTKDFLVALKYFNKEIEKDIENEELYSYRGDNKFNLKDFQGALEDYKKALLINPQNKINYFSVANTMYLLEDFSGSLEEINKLMKLTSEKAAPYIFRGNINFKLKNYQESLKDFNKAINLSPKSAHSYRHRAFVKYKLNDVKGSCSDYKKSIDYGYKEFEFAITKISNNEISWCKNIID